VLDPAAGLVKEAKLQDADGIVKCQIQLIKDLNVSKKS
jgi:hypothetical protein